MTTMAERKRRAARKGFVFDGTAFHFTLTDPDGKKLTYNGEQKLTVEQVDELLDGLPDVNG